MGMVPFPEAKQVAFLTQAAQQKLSQDTHEMEICK
jgi:hypothetical protein